MILPLLLYTLLMLPAVKWYIKVIKHNHKQVNSNTTETSY